MKKITCLLLGCFVFCSLMQAESVSVFGKLIDSRDKQPLVGAYVSLQVLGDSTKIYTVSDPDGRFLFENISENQYLLNVHFVGYGEYNKKIKVSGTDLKLSTISMKFSTIELDAVETVALQARAEQKGDTIAMNADAYKTNKNASASDLVKKMPSVEITNGQVQAQGETVTKVLVNGKEFFGNNPMAALSNLPASAIKSVDIFDDASEQSKLTGVNDGNTSKTMNIIMRPGMDKGVFGKVAAGLGSTGKYSASGNINVFNGDQRISIIGLTNNINIQNFSSEDLLGVVTPSQGGGRRRGRGDDGSNNFQVSSQGGISKTNSVGLNYQDIIAKKVKIAASYFFNQSQNHNEIKTYQNYFANNQNYYSLQNTNSTNINHRFNLKMDYQIDDNNLIRLISRFSLQENTSSSVLNSTLQDSLGSLLTAVDNEISSNSSGSNLNNQLMYQHKFAKQGRIFVANLKQGFSPNSGTYNQYSLTNDYEGNKNDSINQRSITDNKTQTYGIDLNYVEPIFRNSSLIANVHYDKEQSDADKQTFQYSQSDLAYNLLDTALSNVYNNDFDTKSGQLGYSYKDKALELSAEAQYQVSSLYGEQLFPYPATVDKNYNAILPMVRLRYQISESQRLGLTYRTNTKNPSSNQLQNAVDNSNPLQLSTGNSELNQQYSHTVFIRYSDMSKDRTSMLYGMLIANLANDYITSNSMYAASDTVINGISVGKGAYLTRPENIDGYRSVRTYFGYGTPLSSLKSNINVRLNGSWTRTPGLIDNELNMTTTKNYGIGFTLSSNISENLDYTLGTSSQQSLNSNTLQTSPTTKYFNQSSSANLDWIFGPGITLQTRLTHQFNAGYDESVKKNMFICNLGLGKKLFHDKGELAINVYDLFNQSNTISQTSTDYYQQQQESLTLQRYFMLTFTYLINSFTEGSAPKIPKNQGHWGGAH